MQTKPLLYGLIGFFLGGFSVALAATTFDKPTVSDNMSTTSMTTELNGKSGDSYDEAFIASMIKHHESAVNMAKLSPNRAKHTEIQQLSKEIIAAQESEITQMKQWQKDWGYKASTNHSTDSH